MSLIIVYVLVMTILVGNTIYAIETTAFTSAKSALNNALVALSVDSEGVINQLEYGINSEYLKRLVVEQMEVNYPYVSLQLEFYFYNQATGLNCIMTHTICDGVQIRITSKNSYFSHHAEVRYEVSIGG